jgi:hypothetical protein
LAFPEAVELAHHPINQVRLFGQYTQFEVSPAVGLRAQAGTRQVRRAEVQTGRINNHRLAVQARAAADGQPFGQLTLQLAQGRRRRHARMQQPDLHAPPRQAAEVLHNRLRPPAARRHQHGLKIGGHDVDRHPRGANALHDDAAKMVGIEHQLHAPIIGPADTRG